MKKWHWKSFKTKYPNVRFRKVEKAIMFSLQRAKYFLGADLPLGIEHTTSRLIGDQLEVYSNNFHSFYFELFEMDALIRTTDDMIDEDLLTSTKIDEEEIMNVIKKFERDLPEGARITRLFRNESYLRSTDKQNRRKELLSAILWDRSSDIDLLVDQLLVHYGTEHKKDMIIRSRKFLYTWEQYETAITDLWYSRQDKTKNSFNVFNFIKRESIEYSFLVKLLDGNLQALNTMLDGLKGHKYHSFLVKASEYNKKIFSDVYIKLIREFFKDEELFYQSFLAMKLI
ncbi:MAG TPA: hypothetical protein ENI23_04455 [bacterium]|nr:hypothetical protein [bacterium]